ncbi:hypothetical protein GGF42_003855 [Coemansia sp. RSA 2424]|nr:hypothetical protein GGF42_003855 [Coemansia sp. RSA 2424]
MAISGNGHSTTAMSANTRASDGLPQQTKHPAYLPTPRIVNVNLSTSSAHNSSPQRAAKSYHSGISRTTTIEEPFHLAPAAITSVPANELEKGAREFGAHLQSPQPQPSYIFDIVGDEVSVVLLSDSSVVSKWREPPAQVLTPAAARQVPAPINRVTAKPSPLARQQSAYIAIETSVAPVRTSPALPTSLTFQDAPWDGLVLVSSAPHPATLTVDIQSSYATSVLAKPTHRADSNNDRSSGAKDSDIARLSDGYIVLISIAALFVCATLFYFYARYFKHRKASSSGDSPSHPNPHASQPPSPDMAVEQKRPASINRDNRNMLDSGTGMNFQGKSTDAADGKGKRTLDINAMSMHQPPSALFHLPSHERYAVHRYADLGKQDRAADSALKDRYINYRHPGAMGAEGGAAAAHHLHAATRQRIPSFQGSVADSPRELPMRATTSGHAMNSLSQFEMPPPQTWPRPIAAQEPTDPLSASCADFKDKSALLDTSSANPSLNSKAGNSPGMRIKTRKLVRDSTKRTSGGTPSKLEHKSPASSVNMAKLENQHASPDAAEAKKVEQSKSNHSVTLRTKLWNSVHLPKRDREPVADEAVEMHASVIETDHGTYNEPDKLSPLMESIESFSESYQFTIRHKPPLGPLRVVEPHAPALADELSTDRGHHMFVIGEFADGWVLAINASRNNECGMVPRRCLFFPTAPFMTKEAINASMSPSGTTKAIPHFGLQGAPKAK